VTFCTIAISPGLKRLFSNFPGRHKPAHRATLLLVNKPPTSDFFFSEVPRDKKICAVVLTVGKPAMMTVVWVNGTLSNA